MKFVCEECGETTDVASVRLEKATVFLTCAHCGVEARLGAERDDGATEEGPTAEVSTAEESTAEESTAEESTIEETAEDEAEGSEAEAEVTDDEDEAADEDAALKRAVEARGLAPHKCPKCFHRQRRDDFCERCGLDLSSDDLSFEQWDNVPDGLEEEFEVALKLWADVERSPSLNGVHEAFVEHCSENELLELAVRRYRSRLADYPGESPTENFATIATQRLEVLALAKISTDRWSDDLSRRIRAARRVLFIVAVVLLVLGLVLVVVMFRQQGALLPGSI